MAPGAGRKPQYGAACFSETWATTVSVAGGVLDIKFPVRRLGSFEHPTSNNFGCLIGSFKQIPMNNMRTVAFAAAFAIAASVLPKPSFTIDGREYLHLPTLREPCLPIVLNHCRRAPDQHIGK